MSISELWKSSPQQLANKHVQQVISFAGIGQLRDGNDTSKEFRSFLQLLPSEQLSRYASECLDTRFDSSGFVLQDIVNEAGRRLGFEATNGRYRGTGNEIGFDGLWRSPDDHCLVVEVKTTDAYRIDLNVIAGYRSSLVSAGRIDKDKSSILVVVGRQDTGDLEAQIRGSRHAWDIRILSVEALFRLVSIREHLEDPGVSHKIHHILIPREYTRVDSIIDIVFSAAADVSIEVSAEEGDESIVEEAKPAASGKKPKFIPVSFHDECISKVQNSLGTQVVRRSRTLFATPDNSTAVLMAVSKEHTAHGSVFWFAFHPHQQEFLEASANAFIALGCGSAGSILLIPFPEFKLWLPGMYVTKKEDREYKHVKVGRKDGEYWLIRRAGEDPVQLTKFVINVTT